MIRAYLDESGTHGNGWVFVAGFLGTDEQWEQFVPKWTAALGSRRTSLHMRRLRWNKDRTRQLLARLGPIPHECGLEIVMGGIKVEHYEDLIAGTADAKVLNGYVAAMTPMVIQVLSGVPPNERIEFVFEEQGEYEPAVDWVMSFASMSNDGRAKLAGWKFVPKGSAMIEAADYVAFALREENTNHDSIKARWTNPILAAGDGTGYGTIMTRQRARRAIQNSQKLFRETWGDD